MTAHSIESKVGDTTYFNCSTNLESWEIFWYHGDNYVYTGHGILDPYRERFQIETNESIGSRNLVIRSVESGDAGEYICIDNDGIGQRRSVELVVLDNDPKCQSNMHPDGVIGQNIFDIPPDEVKLTCSGTYYGRIPPQMEWKKVGDNSSIMDSVSSNVTSNRFVHTLNLRGDISLDKSSYVCKTTGSMQIQYKCTSEMVNVLYFGKIERERNALKGDMITCNASNRTVPSTITWYYGSNKSHLSYNETITAHLLGEYFCDIMYYVRGAAYVIETLKVLVVDATTATPTSTSGMIISVAVVVTVAIASAVGVVALAVGLRVYVKKIAASNTKQRQLEAQGTDVDLNLLLKNRLHAEIDAQSSSNAASNTKERQLEVQGTDVDLNLLLAKRFRAEIDAQSSSSDGSTMEEEIELPVLHKIRSGGKNPVIVGVSILGGKLYLISEKRPELAMYDCDDFSLTPESLDVKELVDPVDICSCKENVCLYVMDNTPKRIFMIGTKGQLGLLRHWPTKFHAGGHLSATTEGNVIITVHDGQHFMLLEYSSNGNLLREIELHGCKNPSHGIKVGEDKFIVSHGALFDRLHRVCLVDKTGDVKVSFGRRSGLSENQLSTPYYLAVVSTDYVIVADLGNSRVLLLDANLELKTKIVPHSKQQFRNPTRICLDEKRLVVVISAGRPKKAIFRESDEFTEEATNLDTLVESNSSSRKPKVGHIQNVETLKRIEKDCRILVFDIKPLLQKYCS